MKELVVALLGLIEEWSCKPEYSFCPCCYEQSRAGAAERKHKPDCKRAALLAQARAYVASPIDRIRQLREERGLSLVEAKDALHRERDGVSLDEHQAKLAQALDDSTVVQFAYMNWKDEVAVRTVRPLEMYFGTHEKHPTPRWILRAFDLDKGAERHFAMERVRSWVSYKA
jgi:predicted DNA-binding transcriptional regulator YafY